MKAPVRIIGVGNPLMGDDGVGIAAVERLRRNLLPPGVEILDGGTAGIGLLSMMEDAGTVLLIDALDHGAEPGSVVRLPLEQLDLDEADNFGDPHSPCLAVVLALGKVLDLLPPLALYGVQPDSVERREGLSPPVAAALDGLVERIIAEVKEY